MLDLIKRREVKALLRERRTQASVALLTGVSLSSVKRIAKEADIDHLDDAAERRRRRIGRPSKVRPFRGLIVEILNREPDVKPFEVLKRLRLLGYEGGKTAFYSVMAALRAERAAAAARSSPGSGVAAGTQTWSAGSSTPR